LRFRRPEPSGTIRERNVGTNVGTHVRERKDPRNARQRLSQLEVANAKVGMHADGGGLYLQVTKTCAGQLNKSWLFRYSVGGHERQMGLGSLTEVKLADARQKAAECRQQRLDGIDPIEARESARRLADGSGVTFRSAFELFFATKRKSLSNAKHAAQWPSTMETYVFPTIGHRPVAEVEAREILDLLAPIWFAKPETARRILQRMEAVFKSAILRGYRQRVSPCVGVKEELGTRHQKASNHRALDYQRVPAFLAELRVSNSQPATRLAFEWLVLTATRSGETRLARWDEIDERARLWTIPAERMKAKRSHVVPLCKRCLVILELARAMYPSSNLIFPGTKLGSPLSDMTFTKVLRDMGYAIDATPHGMRSAFKDWSAEIAKARDEVSEAALTHTIRGKVRAAYLRTDFLKEREALMAMWERYCAGDVRASLPRGAAA
jgi:integrase